MDKIIVLGGRDIVQGFMLVGVTEVYGVPPEEADQTLLEIMQRKDAGIVIIQADYYGRLSPKTRHAVETVSKPVVVPVGMSAGASGEDLQALIKRAIGISLEK